LFRIKVSSERRHVHGYDFTIKQSQIPDEFRAVGRRKVFEKFLEIDEAWDSLRVSDVSNWNG